MKVYECILSLIAGVGVFILAMKLMSDSLNQIAGERMKRLLEKLAGNRIVGVLVGALVTAVIQSSSATTVMVIGFVNANVMDLNQAAAIIIGSNIGTTVTGLLASLESLNISLYLSLLVFIGVMLAFVRKIRKIANLMTGLGMIFVGLKMMSSACDDQSIRDAFSNVLKNLEFPLLLELLGIIFTAIIQSSSAMTGIVIVMVGKKAMTIRNGLFITLGANIGTCVTAMIGIIGANTNSKRTALIHLIFNVSGCIIFTPILWIFSDSIVNILSKMSNEDAQRIAFFHLFFNIATAIITTPLIKFLVKFVSFVIKNKDKPEEFLEWFIKDKEDKDEGLLNPRPSSNSVNINIINEENAIIDTNQSESNDDTIIKEDKLIKDDSNKAQNLIIKDDIKKDENKILINNNEKENDKMIN
jgi:phosphate:Na+ symporter